MRRIQVIDSHTGGEPTRIVLAGGPDLGGGSVREQADRFRPMRQFQEIVSQEPRGSEILVSALLVPPGDNSCDCGVIFFNNTGLLGMCGHGTIGLVVSLAYLGRVKPGTVKIETPVGIVSAVLHDAHRVSVTNVPSWRYRKDVRVGEDSGDIAWGGNWFFLIKTDESLHHDRVETLTEQSWKIRQTLEAGGITGEGGALIDHIELTGPAHDPANHGRNFVLCPGKAYDRSPCGTGTSAKLACLAADGKLAPGQIWRQESITGSVFEASYQSVEKSIIPTITGTAFVTAEATLLVDPQDMLIC